MKRDGERRDIEGLLGSVKLKAAPPELREKVLRAAAKRREETAWTTPLLRQCMVACAALLLVVSIADGLMSRTQRDRLIALGGGPRPSVARPDDEAAVLAEVLGNTAASELVAMETAAGRRRSVRRPQGDEIRQIELLMEGTDESQKDLH